MHFFIILVYTIPFMCLISHIYCIFTLTVSIAYVYLNTGCNKMLLPRVHNIIIVLLMVLIGKIYLHVYAAV